MKKWVVKSVDDVVVKSLAQQTGLSVFICKILVARGIVTSEMAQEYFNKCELSDPMLIQDMDSAVREIQNALDNGDKITVYGDYDCDGITSTVMLYSYLEAVGGEADWYIPTREEGYGLNEKSIKLLHEKGTQLIITVDNGVSAIKEAELIYQLGMRLIITDHHQVPDELPRAAAVINLHRKDDITPYKTLAGCGVVLKLIMALERDIDSVMEQYGDLAAIGTIGDVVPLTGENRSIVSKGMENMIYSENLGLNRLMSKARVSEENLTSTALAFTVCPRINAAGRYGNPKAAAELFLCDNLAHANTKAEELCLLNTKRQETEQQILLEVEAQLSENPDILNQRVIIVVGENWNHGIIGIVSARLLDRYGKPNLVIGIENGEARGSGRSIVGFSLYTMLDNVKDCLIKFGGHTKAAGFSLDINRLDEFKQRVFEYAEINFPDMPQAVIEADLEMTSADLDMSLIENLDYLEPFGEGNQAPLFLLKNCLIKSIKALKDGKYTSFSFDFGGKEYRALCFGIKFSDFWYNIGSKVDILANADINEYNNRKSISIRVKDIRVSGFAQEKYFSAKSFYEKIIRGEHIDERLLKRIIPEVKDLKLPYDLIRKHSDLQMLEGTAIHNGINYCMFRVTLDIFKEFGHLEIDNVQNKVSFIKEGGRRIELEKSQILQNIKRCAE